MLKEYKLKLIDNPLQIKPAKSILEKWINDLKESKQ